MKQHVLHLVDDASWGGVNRLLDCLTGSGDQALDQHEVMRVERGTSKAPVFKADVIVSHMSACWKNLPYFSSLRATNPETPLIHVEHSYSEHFVALKVQKKDRFDDLLHLTYCLFDKIVAVSAPQAEWIARKHYCQVDQLVTISSCVRLGSFLDVASRRPTGPYTLGCIGRFHEQKGFDLVVDAFVAANPANMRLLMIGDGPMKQSLVEKAKGHPQILFQGSTDTPSEAMALCDAVAMPSRWEPYGLVALEAMAAGRNVFCAQVDGLLQHISNGGIAVPQNTIEGWRQLLNAQVLRNLTAAPSNFTGAAMAEHEFITSWNKLIRSLVKQEDASQMAA
jgi:D-inositol-3-phosphate glycosyltransferase